MNIKKYILIAVGTFLVIVALAVCVSARFTFSNITVAPYAFIETFFSQWSPTLSVIGTFIIAILAFLAIYDNRRIQRLAINNQYLSNVEEWVRTNLDMLTRINKTFMLLAPESKRKKTLENENNILEAEERTLKEQKVLTNEEKGAQSAEASNRLEDINKRLIENIQKRIDINKQIMEIDENSVAESKTILDELRRMGGQVAYSEMKVKSVARLMGDDELAKFLDSYFAYGSNAAKVIEEDNFNKGIEIIEEMTEILSTVLNRVGYLRDKNY
jgi:hypothetical protein